MNENRFVTYLSAFQMFLVVFYLAIALIILPNFLVFYCLLTFSLLNGLAAFSLRSSFTWAKESSLAILMAQWLFITVLVARRFYEIFSSPEAKLEFFSPSSYEEASVFIQVFNSFRQLGLLDLPIFWAFILILGYTLALLGKKIYALRKH